jgi:hypothetical protein
MTQGGCRPHRRGRRLRTRPSMASIAALVEPRTWVLAEEMRRLRGA